MDKLKIAIKLATIAHQGQTDKSGKDYIFHPLTVANGCKTKTQKIVAFLHDTIEDTFVTKELLELLGFSKKIIDAVDTLTFKEGASYTQYIENIKKNPLATYVKIRDLTHNSDLTRLENPTAEDLERNEKYKKCLAFLQSDAITFDEKF